MKIQNYTFINPSHYIKNIPPTAIKDSTIKSSYVAAGGLLGNFYPTYGRTGKVEEVSEEYRKVSTKSEWDIKI